MRRCRYFERETWCYLTPKNKIEKASTVRCFRGQLVYVWDGISEVPCSIGNAPCYTPVELDPYWKDIFDETNRRLYNV